MVYITLNNLLDSLKKMKPDFINNGCLILSVYKFNKEFS